MKIIGKMTTYHGKEHGYLTGHKVKIIAIMKDSAKPGRDPLAEPIILRDDYEIERAGGVGRYDRVEVAPWLPEKGRVSFATSDPLAIDLDCFKSI